MTPAHSLALSREFLCLYCRRFNEDKEFLHLFYREDSVLCVKEQCREEVRWYKQASNLNDIKRLLSETLDSYNITLTDCNQTLLRNEDVLMEITGTLNTADFADEREFEQEVILSRCGDLYYIVKDTMTLLLPPPALLE